MGHIKYVGIGLTDQLFPKLKSGTPIVPEKTEDGSSPKTGSEATEAKAPVAGVPAVAPAAPHIPTAEAEPDAPGELEKAIDAMLRALNESIVMNYAQVLKDVASVCQTLRAFIRESLSGLEHLSPNQYIAALNGFLFPEFRHKWIANPIEGLAGGFDLFCALESSAAQSSFGICQPSMSVCSR